MAAGQPKPAFYVALAVVVLGLIGYSPSIATATSSRPTGPASGRRNGQPGGDGGGIEPKDLGLTRPPSRPTRRAPTTVKEYKFKPAEKLPAVKGTSAYKPLEDNNTVRFALNVWAGWAPIVLANKGFKAGKEWKTADGKPFKVDLVLIDNPVADARRLRGRRSAHRLGDARHGAALPGELRRRAGRPESRIMPRIYQQVDFSNGGDGIVVRENIKTVADLRGKKIVLAQNSPSHYFAAEHAGLGRACSLARWNGLHRDAFQAAAAFNAKKDLAACVSWAPDIYNLAKAKGNRLLVTTKEANHLIADVWFARADFARDQRRSSRRSSGASSTPWSSSRTISPKQKVSELMAAGYNIPATDALGMLGDAHSTNWAENFQFFLNQNNPTNFERIWQQSYMLYRRIGAITHRPVPFDQVMDFSIIQKLGKDAKYASQKVEYGTQFAPKELRTVRAESSQLNQ